MPSNTMPSNTCGLAYISPPTCTSRAGVVHTGAPVCSSNAARYGPWQAGPAHVSSLDSSDTPPYPRPPSTATDELMPPLDTLAFHTSAPVSAFMANTHPRLDATNTHPSATTGVPAKSPSPPAAMDENVHTG